MAKTREMRVKFNYQEDAEAFQSRATSYLEENTPTYNGKGVTKEDLMMLLPGTQVVHEEDERWGWDEVPWDPEVNDARQPQLYPIGKYWVVTVPGMTELN